jgi:hypothetical protein
VAEPELVQERDGLLFDGETPHYRAVSGVLAFDGLSASSLGVVSSRLILNPFANHSLTVGLSGFAKATVKDTEWVHEPGKSVAEMLDLPEGWPGVERER